MRHCRVEYSSVSDGRSRTMMALARNRGCEQKKFSLEVIYSHGCVALPKLMRGITKLKAWHYQTDAWQYQDPPALSGLATELQKQIHGHYLAGMWAEHLHNGLLWQAGDIKLTLPSSGPLAPSWSWAALEGPV